MFQNIGDGLNLYFHERPAPWFIYAFMGMGLCCAASLALVTLQLKLLMAVAFVFTPYNCCTHSTQNGPGWHLLPLMVIGRRIFHLTMGDLHSLRGFIEANADVFKWVGISIVIIQIVDHDIEGDYDVRGRTWEPLLNPQLSQTSGAIKGDFDIWSSRMREKYGLHGGDAKYNILNQNTSADMKSKQ